MATVAITTIVVRAQSIVARNANGCGCFRGTGFIIFCFAAKVTKSDHKEKARMFFYFPKFLLFIRALMFLCEERREKNQFDFPRAVQAIFGKEKGKQAKNVSIPSFRCFFFPPRTSVCLFHRSRSTSTHTQKKTLCDTKKVQGPKENRHSTNLLWGKKKRKGEGKKRLSLIEAELKLGLMRSGIITLEFRS